MLTVLITLRSCNPEPVDFIHSIIISDQKNHKKVLHCLLFIGTVICFRLVHAQKKPLHKIIIMIIFTTFNKMMLDIKIYMMHIHVHTCTYRKRIRNVLIAKTNVLYIYELSN